MYATLVDSAGYTILDVNRAFNPPCAFTAFATCPLPPAEHVITVRILAEKKTICGPTRLRRGGAPHTLTITPASPVPTTLV